GIHGLAPTVQIRGHLPSAHPGRLPEILVSRAHRARHHPGARALTRPADLTELSGGITLAQYDAIRRLPGVQVAAPLTMVGYIPLTVSFQASVPAVVQNMARPVFVLSALHCASNGLSTLTQRTIGSGYAIRDLNGKQSRATGRLGGRRPRPPNVTV